MKRRKWYFLCAAAVGVCLAAVIICFAAKNNKTAAEGEDTVYEIISESSILNTDNWQQEGLESIGLSGAEVSASYESHFGTLHVLDRKNEDTVFGQVYFALEGDGGVRIFKISEWAAVQSLYLCDIDSEEGEEIIYADSTGGCGGAGSHTVYVFRITDRGLKIIFYGERGEDFDNGFESKLIYPFSIEVANEISGFETVLDCSDIKEYYIGFGFDEGGNPTQDGALSFDCVFDVSPTDADGDGVYELVCTQYAYFGSVAAGMGEAVTVIRYNAEAKRFEVFDGWFEPYDRQ